MWCERCERAVYGTDEHQHPEWLALCRYCDDDLTEEKADAEWLRAEHQPVHVQPVTEARVDYGHPRYRECYGDTKGPRSSWRRYFKSTRRGVA